MREWTIETAKAFLKRNKTKGLKYWSAYDFLVRNGAMPKAGTEPVEEKTEEKEIEE